MAAFFMKFIVVRLWKMDESVKATSLCSGTSGDLDRGSSWPTMQHSCG
jgi:hypothetical protein